MVQRVLGAKNLYHAQMGITFASFLKLLLPFIVVIPGLIYFGMHPEVLLNGTMAQIRPEADKTYINLIRELVPAGVKGLLLAALFGAIQSTVSAVLNSTSTILTLDFYKRYLRPDAYEQEVLKVGKIITATVLIVSIFLGIWVSTLGESLFIYIQELFTFFAPPFSAVFLLGAFWPRINGKGALVTTIFGLILGVLIKVWVRQGGAWGLEAPDWLFPYANQGVINWAFCMVLCIAVSLNTSPPRPEQVTEDLTFSFKRLWNQRDTARPWYQQVALWWGISVIGMFLLIFIFSFVL